ncbi:MULTISPECIES: glycoside hydrolase family 3 N-terminal domain-containing protein [unclassified Beijerinckia]|uniref:glycoside hydrolase family 3 protein n=1 Tax=unclassified Beijerinckia TaxID=2638183 RepID=UPI0008973757|nr:MULTISPECIES: glycoside hydrolase family 3 N-terminal domain-containing protein [unclassified Beijerinckia]MDH7796553.1 beta-N-acetylhexosaminidase [Beijerinckia sp. GAS462]SEC49970.1 beta-N-acetylhexosaminidase [Beijerinckia sp. 28-YEA-48]
MSLSRRHFLAATSALAAPYVTRASAAADDAMIGQMLILGFSGTASDAGGAQGLARQIAAGQAGGVCFLGHNTRSRQGIESLTRLFGGAGRQFKPLIAVDQEGGAVQRLGAKSGYNAVQPAQAIAARGEPTNAERVYAAMARELKSAGFNLNLAPVVDLGFEPRNPIIAKWGRAFGQDGATVAKYASAFVEGHRSAGVLTALKHFPGHGSTLGDSHEKPVDLTATWKPEELEPYRRMARSGDIDIVMSGHLSHARLTGGEPATLSRAAIEGVLRRDIGYQGVAMTDDLDMAAIRSSYTLSEAVIRAISAGNDLLLLSNSRTPDPNLPAALIASVKEAVATGRIPAGRIEASAARIGSLKQSV